MRRSRGRPGARRFRSPPLRGRTERPGKGVETGVQGQFRGEENPPPLCPYRGLQWDVDNGSESSTGHFEGPLFVVQKVLKSRERGCRLPWTNTL